jgi:hypothetical protein
VFKLRNRKSGDSNKVTVQQDRIHMLLLAGDADKLRTVLLWMIQLPGDQMSRNAPLMDDSGLGAVVTSDAPGPLRERCVALGLKVCTVSMPRRHPDEDPHRVAMDLKITGEYAESRRE